MLIGNCRLYGYSMSSLRSMLDFEGAAAELAGLEGLSTPTSSEPSRGGNTLLYCSWSWKRCRTNE